MTKSKSVMVTRDSLCLIIDILKKDLEIKTFLLFHLNGYLLSMTHGNRFLLRGSKEIILSITIAGNVSVNRELISLVTHTIF